MTLQGSQYELNMIDLKIRRLILKLGANQLVYVVAMLSLLIAHVSMYLSSDLKLASHLALTCCYVYLCYKITSEEE